MNRTQTPITGTGQLPGHRFGLVAGAAVAGMALFAASAQAATPNAGTKIGNQAFATYDNGTGTPQTTTSNVVETEVLPVYDLLLVPGSTKQVSPGGEVKWSHTLSNEGNAPDIALLDLLAQTGDFDLQNVKVFLDQNQDGIPDDANNLNGTNISLAIGESVNLIVVGLAPNTATNGQQDQVDLRATSTIDASVVDTDNNFAIVAEGGVVAINKSIVDTPVGLPETQDVTIKIVVTNTGNDDATNVTVDDLIPAGMTYTAGTASVNAVNGGSVTDADDAFEPAGADDSTIQLSFKYDDTLDTMEMVIPTLAVGEVVEVTFDVSIDAGTAAGDIVNTANVVYDAGAVLGRTDSDQATYTVLAQPNVTLTGETIVEPQVEGAVVSLTNVITNTGTTDDDYDIVVDLRIGEADGYPVGTTYTLLVDGSPLVSNDNNNAFPDIEVAAGATRNIILRVTLPTDVDPLGTVPYVATKTAISLTDSNISATAQDIINEIKASVVDLTNGATNLNDTSGAPGADGAGAGPEATPVSTVSGVPGETVELELIINNANDPAQGNVSDNYALSASTISPTPGGAGFVYDVRFFTPGPGGTEITVTPDIAPGASYTVIAKITIPANEAASDLGTDGKLVTFQVESLNSGAIDSKLDSVFVTTVREVVLEDNDQRQTFPGGVVIYDHQLTNTGNVTEADVTLSVTDTNSTDYLPSTIYLDVNGDGLINGGDIINPTQADIQANAVGTDGLKDGSFDPQDTVAILLRVQAQSSAPSGAQNVSELIATVDGVVNGVSSVTVDGAPEPIAATTSNDDITTVVAGDITLEKYQALDATCDGVADGAYRTTLQAALPGTCIVYRIVATNTGTRVAQNLVISDATPSFTTYNGGEGFTCADTPAAGVDGIAQVSGGTGGAGITTSITCGTTGLISGEVGTLLPTDPAAVMTFSVKIDND